MKPLKRLRYMIYAVLILSCLCMMNMTYADTDILPMTAYAAEKDDTVENDDASDAVRLEYQEYLERLEAIEYAGEISSAGFRVVEDQIFPIELGGYGEVSLMPAFDRKYSRVALFFVDEEGKIVYRTEQLETNHRIAGQIKQPDSDIDAVSFRDLDEDGRMDIILITSCESNGESYDGKQYRLGDVLFQNRKGIGFYRDYRISDKINRFGMSKSAELITAFVRDDYSTEFLYTATTLDELQKQGLYVISEQTYFRNFEKLGRLQVVPGTYRISSYDVFMIYLVNEQGDIVSSLQPMGGYDNLYALRGISCRDIDGDGLKDIVVLARYSYEGEEEELVVETDYSIYYQRTGGFSADTDIKNTYRCSEDETMELVVEKARAYWGWKVMGE